MGVQQMTAEALGRLPLPAGSGMGVWQMAAEALGRLPLPAESGMGIWQMAAEAFASGRMSSCRPGRRATPPTSVQSPFHPSAGFWRMLVRHPHLTHMGSVKLRLSPVADGVCDEAQGEDKYAYNIGHQSIWAATMCCSDWAWQYNQSHRASDREDHGSP